MLQIAHRGYSNSTFHDNSIESIKNAVDNQFDWIEIDVQTCKSGEIIVFHDTYINDDLIIDLSLNEITKQIPYIATLECVLKCFEKQVFYLDVKGTSNTIIKQLESLLQTYKQNEYHIGSFNCKLLNQVKLYKKGIITENIFSLQILSNLIIEMEFLCCHWTMLDEDIIKFCHKYGVKVFAYTYKEKIDLFQMRKFKIDGIVSNFKILEENIRDETSFINI